MSLNNVLQPQLIRYDASIDANVPNQSLKLRACSHRATCCDETNDTVLIENNCYRPQRSWAKVMFLQASVILFRGGGPGGLPQCMRGYPPPHPTHTQEQTPTPNFFLHFFFLHFFTFFFGFFFASTHSPCPPHPPPAGSRLRHTVNERPVRIVLECILVSIVFNESSIARVVVALTLTLGVNGPLVFCKPYSDPVCAVCCSRIEFIFTCRFHWLMKTGPQIIICANTSRSGIC